MADTTTEPPEWTAGADLPGVSWLVSVLTGKTEPGGTEVPLGEALGGKPGWAITASAERLKTLLLDLAKLYTVFERETYRLRREGLAAVWHLVSDPPPHSSVSARRHYPCLVTSAALRALTGVDLHPGRYTGNIPGRAGTWEVRLRGRWVAHTPEHWRDHPPLPPGAVGVAGMTADQKDEMVRLDAAAD